MASIVSEIVPKFTAEALKSAAKQSERCHIVPLRLRKAIKKYLRGKFQLLFLFLMHFCSNIDFIRMSLFRVFFAEIVPQLLHFILKISPLTYLFLQECKS